jgi:uncharacterized protein
MPVLVNLRHLATRHLEFKGRIEPAELEIDNRDEMVQVKHPLEYELEVEQAGANLVVGGELSMVLECACVRCLKPFPYELRLQGPICVLALEGEEKVPIISDSVDLTPFLREHILLEFPPHPLCKPDCGGLSLRRGKRPAGSPRPGPAGDASSPWGELDKLKL